MAISHSPSFRKSFGILLFGAFLAGCAAQGPEPGSSQWFLEATEENKIYYYKDICKKYGLKEWTAEMESCIQGKIKEKAQEIEESGLSGDDLGIRAVRGLQRNPLPQRISTTGN